MKRLIPLLLAAVLLCSCGTSAIPESVTDAVGAAYLAESRSAKFRLDVKFGDERATFLFAQGSYEADYKAAVLTAEMTQTVLGTASAVKVSYADGKSVIVSGENETEETVSPEDFFGQVLYHRPFLQDYGVSTVKKTQNSSGELYVISYSSADTDKLFSLFGDDIFPLAYINTPQKDKTKCSDLVITVGIENGCVTSYGFAFTMSLYDTPPYVPGMTANDDDYRLDLYVDYTAEFKN